MASILRYEMHGMKKSPEYSVWKQMKYRCTEKSKDFLNYGARGISVCKKWQDSFLAFYNHIGARPSSEYQIDRIDNNGNYEPGNVRWATRSQQARNRRKPEGRYKRYVDFMLWLLHCGFSLRSIAKIFKTTHGTIKRYVITPKALTGLSGG